MNMNRCNECNNFIQSNYHSWEYCTKWKIHNPNSAKCCEKWNKPYWIGEYKAYQPQETPTWVEDGEPHSCSPEECPTCKDKSCANSYEDYIEESEMIL